MHIALTNQEQKDIVAALNGNLYWWGHCKYVLLRLDEAITDNQAKYLYRDISVEHVLPQHPKPNSEWTRSFPDEAIREKYVHCLGNLVLLSGKKNAAAQNYDFKTKVDIYFNKGKFPPFALTFQVIKEDTWTPETIERRQKQLVNRLQDVWRLN